jgi:hypothetical protein
VIASLVASYGELERNREAMARFGTGLKAIARRL